MAVLGQLGLGHPRVRNGKNMGFAEWMRWGTGFTNPYKRLVSGWLR